MLAISWRSADLVCCDSCLNYLVRNKHLQWNNTISKQFFWSESIRMLRHFGKLGPDENHWNHIFSCKNAVLVLFPRFYHMTQLKNIYIELERGKSVTELTDSYPLWITLIYIINWRWVCLSACELLGSIFFFHLPQQTIPLSSDPVSFQSCNINCTLKISSLMFILTN